METIYGALEEYLTIDRNVATYVVIAAITVIVLFYGTRYVFTGVNVASGNNDNIPYKRCNVGHRAAVVSMKGHRQYMEDTYQAVPSFGGRDNWSFYGVFDGHGGARCSVYVAHFLYKHVWSCIDLYLEHYSLNSKNLWKLLLNDENLVSIPIDSNQNESDNENENITNLNSQQIQKHKENNIIDNTKNNTNNNNNNKNSIKNEKITNNDKRKNNESERQNEIKILKTNENNQDLINGSNAEGNENQKENTKDGDTETTLLTSETVEKLEERVPLIDKNNNNTNSNDQREGFKSTSMSVMSQRGSDLSDSEFDTNQVKKEQKLRNNQTKERKKLIGIPKYVNEIMREALIQSHRYADKEFLALANRQQWQDGSTSISCVILPAKDILHALMSDQRNGLFTPKNASNDGNSNENTDNTNNNSNTNNNNSNNNNNNGNNANSNDKERQKALYSIPNSNIMPSSEALLSSKSNNSKNHSNSNSNSNNNSTNNNSHNNNTNNIMNENLTIDDICDDKDTWMFIANTGDSRAILVTTTGESVALSTDHKPNRLDERRRIEEKGGRVVFFGVWRVEGVLAVSRAFGDRRLKRWVVPDPEIISRKVGENDLFMILASDGVWDAVSNEQAARYAYEVWNDTTYSHADLKTKLQAIAGKISSMAFRHGSMDNITALVVHLPSHCTYGIGDVAGLNSHDL